MMASLPSDVRSSVVWTDTFQFWAKCIRTDIITLNNLIKITRDTWNRYIVKTGEENIEKFVECMFSSRTFVRTLHMGNQEISCEHESCKKVFNDLKSLLSKSDSNTTENYNSTEVNRGEHSEDENNRSLTNITSRLDYSFDIAMLYHSVGNAKGKKTFMDCSMYEIIGMMKGCTLFNASESIQEFDKVCREWRTTVCSLDNSMTAEKATVHLQTMEDLFHKLQTEDNRSLCMAAINSIKQISSMNLAKEYRDAEYLEFAKSVLESKRSAIEEEFSDEHNLLQKTEELIHFIDEHLQKEDDDRMKLFQLFNEMHENQRPGKPIASNITAHSIQVSWEPAKMFGQDDYYQVSYKDNSKKGKWKVLAAQHSTCTAQVTDLIPNTKYTFRVRVISQNGEGPSSQDSTECTTEHCSVFETSGSAELISEKGKLPAIYRLQMKQIYENTEVKIRMFEIGNQMKLMENEITIILVGDNETEKSDFVNGILNYVNGVHWRDPFRFVIRNLETQALNRSKINQTQRGPTEWITSYIIYPEENDLSRYQINVIDIPASSRTPNQTAIEQLNQLFTEKECSKAFKEINSLCVFGKTNVSLDNSERLFQSVLSCFGKDLQKITCAIITLDDQKLPILPALDALNIPLCIFHNSSLFASTSMINTEDEEKVVWEKDLLAFEAFFTHLKYSRPCDLKQTTSVIAKRLELNQTIREIQSKVGEGEIKINQLQNEKQNLLDVMKTVEDNSNYTYEVDDEQHVKKYLKQGDNSTVCSICFYTCHADCSIESDNKAQCCSMTNEYCTACPKKCHWTKHTRVPYVYEKVNVKVKKTNDDMLQKYTKASNERRALESTLNNQKFEINGLCHDISKMMQEVSECGKQINECALVRGPFDMARQVDEKLGVQNFKDRAHKETQNIKLDRDSVSPQTALRSVLAWFMEK